jgi:hypothetical protein
MAARTIFVLMSLQVEFVDVFFAVNLAAISAEEELQQPITATRIDRIVPPSSIANAAREALNSADLVIAGVSVENVHIAVEIGMAESSTSRLSLLPSAIRMSLTLSGDCVRYFTIARGLELPPIGHGRREGRPSQR